MEARDDIAPTGAPDGAARVFAAIDLGTNNCRLMLARARGEGFAIVDSFSRIVRLGEGLARNGYLLETAIDRTMQALEICAGKIERWGAIDQRHIATEACRRAANCDEFVARVAERTGLSLEIIPPREEARLALAGCLPLIEFRKPRALLVDIGGGSTEISWIATEGERSQLLDFISLPYGVVTLSEQIAEHYVNGRLPLERYEAIAAQVTERLGEFDARHGISAAVARREVQMIGTSGTVTTVAAINLGLRRYNRNLVDGTAITRGAINMVCRSLLAEDLAGLAANGCIGTERADLVLAGCAILEGVSKRWPVDPIGQTLRHEQGHQEERRRRSPRRRPRQDHPRQDRARAHRVADALAAAPAQRSFRRSRQARRLSLARGL
jgi:exopolyphosphatase/guanosine-5'-triphosphate,3'-diphosphate pyrophosphatase